MVYQGFDLIIDAVEWIHERADNTAVLKEVTGLGSAQTAAAQSEQGTTRTPASAANADAHKAENLRPEAEGKSPTGTKNRHKEQDQRTGPKLR